MEKMKSLSREDRRAAAEQQGIQMRGKREGKKWVIALGFAIPFFIMTLVLVIIAAVYLSRGSRVDSSQADMTNAQAVLKEAVSVASQYAGQNKGSYASMGASDLKKLSSTIDWVNGTPGVGQIGIVEIGDETYRLAYKNPAGVEFHAVRDAGGTVKYATADGQPLK